MSFQALQFLAMSVAQRLLLLCTALCATAGMAAPAAAADGWYYGLMVTQQAAPDFAVRNPLDFSFGPTFAPALGHDLVGLKLQVVHPLTPTFSIEAAYTDFGHNAQSNLWAYSSGGMVGDGVRVNGFSTDLRATTDLFDGIQGYGRVGLRYTTTPLATSPAFQGFSVDDHSNHILPGFGFGAEKQLWGTTVHVEYERYFRIADPQLGPQAADLLSVGLKVRF